MSTIISSPHSHGTASVDRVMLRVIYALLPATALYAWLYGWGVVTNIVIVVVVALLAETLVLWLRHRPILSTLFDGSALVTALLLAIALPPLAPWWLAALGALFAIVLAKQLYGGLGYNPFNPAMVGYVILLVSFPLEMTRWTAPLSLLETPPGLAASLQQVFLGSGLIDSITMATPLDTIKTELSRQVTIGSTMANNPTFGLLAAGGRDPITLLLLIGGVWLIFKRVIGWQVPLAMLGSLFLIAALFNLIDPERYSSPLFHLFNGGAMLGAFFIATDPVSGATSPRGRILFGIGAGLLTYTIRTWGGYPDGVAFAVLLMNMAAPTIDYYTRPRVYGVQGE